MTMEQMLVLIENMIDCDENDADEHHYTECLVANAVGARVLAQMKVELDKAYCNECGELCDDVVNGMCEGCFHESNSWSECHNCDKPYGEDCFGCPI